MVHFKPRQQTELKLRNLSKEATEKYYNSDYQIRQDFNDKFYVLLQNDIIYSTDSFEELDYLLKQIW